MTMTTTPAATTTTTEAPKPMTTPKQTDIIPNGNNQWTTTKETNQRNDFGWSPLQETTTVITTATVTPTILTHDTTSPSITTTEQTLTTHNEQKIDEKKSTVHLDATPMETSATVQEVPPISR